MWLNKLSIGKLMKGCVGAILYRDNNLSSCQHSVRVIYSPSNILAFAAASSAALPLYHLDDGSG
jgi:hypothetical protein